MKNLKSEKADLKELPLSGYSSRGGPGRPRPVGRAWPNVAPNGCLTFANLQAGQSYRSTFTDLHFHLLNKPADGGDAEIGSRTKRRLFLLGMYSIFCQETPATVAYRHDFATRRVGLQHDAMRTDDLHCGSFSASTQFSIHSLSPLWPKAPHGPNSKTT